MTKTALDVWTKFDTDEEPTHEANTFVTDDGVYRVEWYHVDVGQVSEEEFSAYADAAHWLESHGFIDFTA